MTVSSRPTGITILAALAAIGGVLDLLGGLLLFGLGGVVATAAGAGIGALAVVSGLALIVVGVLYLGLSYGFWMLKPWAWIVGAALAIVSIVVSVVGFIGGGSITSLIISIIIPAIILYYLTRPEIQAIFGRKA
jgi:hypothetical protein